MPHHCCVPQCTASTRKKSNSATFHRFPVDLQRRREWIIKIRRDPGPNFKFRKDTRLCSGHFRQESFIKTPCGLRTLKEDAVPTVFAWSDVTARPERRTVGRGTTSEHTLSAHQDHDYAERPLPLEEQLEQAHNIIKDQLVKIAQLEGTRFPLSRFQGDDKSIMFHTGFPDYTTLKAVFMALQPTADNMVWWSQAQRQGLEEIQRQGFNFPKLAIIDQFFLFLCRLRQGFPEQDLAVHFNVSQSTVSRVCVTWTNFLYCMLGSLPIWPSRASVKERMPTCFQSTFPCTRVILDCTEIHVERPSSKVPNSEIYSHYKGTTTFKGLVGIAPSGEVTFVSDLYTGSVSDKEITRQSGIMSLLEEGDEVMADKGFLIKDLLSERKAFLVILPVLGPSGHFRLRIHVERAIRRIKEYHIFDRVLPMTLAGSVNQLWAVCALLTNFQGPLF